jgi:hypothetical protein
MGKTRLEAFSDGVIAISGWCQTGVSSGSWANNSTRPGRINTWIFKANKLRFVVLYVVSR